ncbi:MAG: neuraminidase-like domain-containing protein [Candidatus Aminicenantes bacterium]|jgi:hypothetical protein
MKIYKIKGRIIDLNSKKGIPRLKVEAWDREQIYNKALAVTTTNAYGIFYFKFTEQFFKEIFADKLPKVFFMVYEDRDLLKNTKNEIFCSMKIQEHKVIIPLDYYEEDELAEDILSVSGYVVYPDRTPVTNAVVKAYDQDFTRLKELGAGVTNPKGFYSISYLESLLSAQDKKRADLTVKVFASANARKPLATSVLILNALPREKVNLVVKEKPKTKPTEYLTGKEKLGPRLEGVELIGLTDRDAAVLAKKTGLELLRVTAFIHASHCEKITGISSEIFYGLFRQNLPNNLPGLLSAGKGSLQKALIASARANIINPQIEDNADREMDKLMNKLAAESFRGQNNKFLKGILKLTGLRANQQKAFLKAYAHHDKPMAEFWQELKERQGFGAARVKNLQFALQLSCVTRNNLPLVRALYTRRDIKRIHDLARLTREDWTAVMEQIQIPRNIMDELPGKSKKERIKNYSQQIGNLVEDTFPTAVLAYRMKKDTPLRQVSSFLLRSPDFDVACTYVGKYLKDLNISISTSLRRDLEAVQRLYRLAPKYKKYDTVKVLWQDKLRSAHAIKRKGEKSFIREFGDKLGETTAREVFQKAAKVTSRSVLMWGKYSSDFNRTGTYVYKSKAGAAKDMVTGLPELDTLFGALDFCHCRHCRSVFSPAAYLADLLFFLEGTEDSRGFTELEKRRPDIPHILLSCQNTNTSMPYIDLVNEILENAVSPHWGGDGANVPQTTRSTAELKAHPEHINKQAYDLLKEEIYPWNFDLWHQEARDYLALVGIKRYQLMEIFRRGDSPGDLDIACQHLDITAKDYEVLTAAADSSAYAYYGMENDHQLRQLREVKKLLKHALLTYEELLALMAAKYINPSGKAIDYAATPCSLENAGLWLDTIELGKLHRFRLLLKKTGWTIPQLDKAINTFAINTLPGEFITALSHILRLQELVEIPVINMLSWWSLIDTLKYEDEPSLYEQLFLDKTINNLAEKMKTTYPHMREDIFKLNSQGDELAHMGESLGQPEYQPLVLKVLDITGEELALLITNELNGNDALNLANLSLLYRVVCFCQALKLSIPHYLSLKALTNQTPVLTPTRNVSPRDTFHFVSLINKIKLSGFDIPTLDYLLRHADPGNSSSFSAPNEETTAAQWEGLKTGLTALKQEFIIEPGSDSTAVIEVLREKLKAIIKQEEDIAAAIAIIKGTSELDEEALEIFFLTYFVQFLDRDTLDSLGDSSSLSAEEITQRAQKILEQLGDYLLGDYVIATLAGELGIETETTASLLRNHLPHPQASAAPAVEFFHLENIETAELASFQDLFVSLFKIAVIIKTLDIHTGQLDFLFKKAPGIGWLDFLALPLSFTREPCELFAPLMRLVDAYRWEETFSSSSFSLFQVLARGETPDETRRSELFDFVSEHTGWNREDIEFLTGTAGYHIRQYNDETWLVRLAEAFKLLKKIDTPALQVWGWNTPVFTDEQAAAVKSAVKARYDNDRWGELAPPLRNRLRKKQRDILQAFLLAKESGDAFESPVDLYRYYLIDSEMAPCFMISRIKLAISSIQLLVQRILMGLEPGIELNRDDAGEWQWRKNYRVWEANRKIFIYPENWIEPELRDDQSPFFKELAEELLQDDINAFSAESAFLNYLHKLDDVAHLEIAGLCKDRENDVLHVFGRTKGDPHIYYYRRWEHQCWTPWEKTDLDIEGDHLLPVIYNRRLYLFWPKFLEKANEEEVEEFSTNLDEREQTSHPAGSHYEIYLCWSTYKQQEGYWTPKKMSSQCIDDRAVDTSDPGRFFLKSYIHPQSNTLYLFVISASYYPGLLNEIFAFFYDGAIFGGFFLDSCKGEVEGITSGGAYHFVSTRPYNARVEGMKFAKNVVNTYTHHLFFIEKRTGANYFGPLMDTYRLRLLLGDATAVFLEYFNIGRGFFQAPHLSKDYKIIAPPHELLFLAEFPFFYEDDTHTFFVVPEDQYSDVSSDNPDIAQTDDSAKVLGEYMKTAHFSHFLDILNAPAAPPEPTNGSYLFQDNMGEFTGFMVDRQSIINQDVSRKGAPYQKKMRAREVYWQGKDPVPIIAAQAPAFSLETRQWTGKKYTFHTFHHPYVCFFIKQLNRYGISGLLDPGTGDPGDEHAQSLIAQQLADDHFEAGYKPTPGVNLPYPLDDIDFNPQGAYGVYNWELFFHAPLLIATRLSQNRKFADAQKWFHFIFDPTETRGLVPARFWRTKPFHEYQTDDDMKELEQCMNGDCGDLEYLVAQWEKNPFQPHLVARFREVAYMKTVVMKYLDNLIAWGDMLFSRDTIESINEATQLYVLGAQILGKRPVSIKNKEPEPKTFNQLKSTASPLETMEAIVPSDPGAGKGVVTEKDIHILDSLPYFCIPENEKLLSYWDTVSDRLFKIRNCMNIEGVVRQLDLFAPPIDPGLLVKAAAAGVDIGEALSDMTAPMPHYRFRYLLGKALELCSDVKTLGTAMLSALEKKDAEEISLLRSDHEVKLYEAIRDLKEKSIEEAEANIQTLGKLKEVTNARYTYYSTRDYMNANEKLQLDKLKSAMIIQTVGQGLEILAGVLALIPQFRTGVAGVFGTPQVGMDFGGFQLMKAVEVATRSLNLAASIEQYRGSKASIKGGYDRRDDDWKFQAELAGKELDHIDQQIAAAELRKAISQKDRDNQNLQIQQAEEIQEVMTNKYTNRQLYNWMVTQLASLYFQGYQLAYDIAKQAEKAYRFELGLTDSNFIQLGYWDSLKKGLLAGEKLHHDLKRLELAYIRQNKREYEISKHISLGLLDPLALLQLKETGTCDIDIPEVLFDLDYPGQYMRRIKSVSLTIPCVVGPYTNVSCKLTLLSSRIRMSTRTSEGYAYSGLEDTRFMHLYGGTPSIATSSAQRDSGLFELNFNDERYLPFERAGVISTWRLELPAEFKPFDYNTISDVIIHMNYTAREGGDAFKSQVTEPLRTALNNMLKDIEGTGTELLRVFSMKLDFPNQWHQFLHPAEESDEQNAVVNIQDRHFSFMLRGKNLQLQKVEILLKPKGDIEIDTGSITLMVRETPVEGWTASHGNLKIGTVNAASEDEIPEEWEIKGEWNIHSTGTILGSETIEDIFLVMHYTIESPS